MCHGSRKNYSSRKQETTIVSSNEVRKLIGVCMRDPSAKVRGSCATILGKLDVSEPGLFTALVGMADRERDLDAVKRAIRAIIDIGVRRRGSSNGVVVEHLYAIYRRKRSDELRAEAARGLVILSANNAKAVAYANSALTDGSVLVAKTVTEEIENLGEDASPQYLPALIRNLNERELQRKSIEAIGNMKEKGVAAVPHLKRFIGDKKNSSVAISALRKIGAGASGVSGDLLPMLKKQDESSCDAAETLARIGGSDSMQAIPYMVQIVTTSKQERLREKAAHALYVFGPKAGRYLPYLKQQFAVEQDSRVRVTLARALNKITDTHDYRP